MPTKQSPVLRLAEINHKRWAVYDQDNRLIILTSNRKIAERFLNGGRVRSKQKRDAGR